MHKALLTFFILCCLNLNLKAGTTAKPDSIKHAAVLRTDTSKIIPRSFDAKALKSYSENPEFDYRTQTETSSWWDRFWQWLWQWLDKFFSGRKASRTKSNPFITYLLIAAATAFVVYVVIKLLKLDHIFQRKAKHAGVAYHESIEDINEIDFDKAIDDAVSLHNYRLAIRLLYLQSLKQLNDAQLINWQIGKTNTAYLNELLNTDHKRSFGLLTHQFEYVWYGNFPVNGDSFGQINSLFIDFKKMLS